MDPAGRALRRRRCGDTPAFASALALAVIVACAGGGDAAAAPGSAPAPTVQERQCLAAGWQRAIVEVDGHSRVALWKAPAAWTRGAIVVLHGGGGTAAHFCIANVALIAPQVRFTEMALAQGFAVFLPDSTDRVTDPAGRPCGKVWDDAAFARDSLDLPFIERLLVETIPALRPAGGRAEVFLTGLSSGGYMTLRAASRLGAHIAGFAPVASGDSYGWQRDCTPRPTDRRNVFGYAFDVDSRRPIPEAGSCDDRGDAHEHAWDAGTARPRFMLLHHLQDGIHDASCVARARRQLLAHGFPETPALTLDGGRRAAAWHFWQDAYNAPMLEFFTSLLAPK